MIVSIFLSYAVQGTDKVGRIWMSPIWQFSDDSRISMTDSTMLSTVIAIESTAESAFAQLWSTDAFLWKSLTTAPGDNWFDLTFDSIFLKFIFIIFNTRL